MAQPSAWSKSRTGLSWTAMGAISSVLVGGLTHLPTAPVYAVDPTPLSVGEDLCEQQVAQAAGLSVLALGEADRARECLVTFTADNLWQLPDNVSTAWVLVVGAGGSGSSFGGGGAGGVYENEALTLRSGDHGDDAYLVVEVGQGGTGGAGGSSQLGNIVVSGGAPGDVSGAGGASGSGKSGGQASSDEIGAIAGGGGAGEGSEGTNALLDRGIVEVGPATETIEEIVVEPEGPGTEDESDDSPVTEESGSDDGSATEDQTGSELGSEPEAGEGVEDVSGGSAEIPEESADPELVATVPLRVIAGNGGSGVTSGITGESLQIAGGGAGTFTTGDSEASYDTQPGVNGTGGGSGAWGGGGAAGEVGGHGVVIVRFSVPEKEAQVLTWDLPSEVSLSEGSLQIPHPSSSGSGTISLEVLPTSTSGCALAPETPATGDDLSAHSLLEFSSAGDCLLRATVSETRSHQAASITRSLSITVLRPVVENLSPNHGHLAGGTRVTVTGRNFTETTEVTFGGLAGTDLAVMSDTTLFVTTPLRRDENFTPGLASVVVQGPNGTSEGDAEFLFHNSTYWLDNGRLRFGGELANNCREGCGESSFTPVSSITNFEVLKQPFYYRAGEGHNQWYKLTYSDYAMDFAIGSGSPEGTSSTVQVNPPLQGFVVSSSDPTWVEQPNGVRKGYGTLVAQGTLTVNGNQTLRLSHTYELGAESSFIKITTKLTNLSALAIPNLHLWVGTKDDWIGRDDTNQKTKGNIVDGAFVPITEASQTASAVLIESRGEGVLFYSTTPGANTIVNRYGAFSQVYGLAPESSAFNVRNDGAYGLYMPVTGLGANDFIELVWFYAAGETAALTDVIQSVASAAEPPKPGVDRGNGTATITWTAPNPGTGNRIVRYEYQTSVNGGAFGTPVSMGLPSPLSWTITGLDNANTYEFQVRAIVEPIAGGDQQAGQWSPSSDSSVLGVPRTPTITASSGVNGSLFASFEAPASPADGVLTYEYRLGSGNWTATTPSGTPLTFSVGGLDNGQSLSLQVRARNSFGPSEPSAAVTVVTAPTFTTSSLGTMTRGSSFSQNLVAGSGVTAWAVTEGTLPSGLTLNPSTGRLSGTPTVSGPYDFTIRATNPSGSVPQRFDGVVGPYWPSNSVEFGGSATTAVATTISTADIQGLVITGGATVTVTGLPEGMAPIVSNESQPGVMPTIVLSGTPTLPGTYPVEVTITGSNGRSVTQTVTLVVSAAPTVQPASQRPRPQPQATVDIAPPVNPPLSLPQNSQQNSLIPVPPVVNGPVLSNGQTPVPQPGQITVRRDGGNENAQARIVGNTGIEVQAGRLNLGLRVTDGSGEVRPLDDGAPEILIEQGARAQFQGNGFLPNSTVQVFLPLQGQNAVELARVQVDQNGALRGDARFLTGPGQAPIPVGPQVLQIVTVDENGRQVTVEMTVNVAQPGPTPDLNRETGEIPTLAPGQSFAMQAGLPVDVRIDIDPESRSTTIDGGDWTMELSLGEGTGNQRTGENGELIVELERDELATVSGTGFMPDTRVDVWLFSTPTLLGTIVTEADGSFTGYVNVDSRVVTVGEHTLQLQGIGTDGYVRSANLGVVVDDGLTQEAEAWPWWWWAIAGGVLGLIVWFIFGRRPEQDDTDGELEAYDPTKRVYGWSVTENSPKRGTYTADLIGVSFAQHG